jgi:hypothetical protein
LCSSKQGFDDLLAQNDQGRHGLESRGGRLISLTLGNATDEFLGTKLFEIVSRCRA